MNGFPIEFFPPKIGGGDHAAFVGGRCARTRREITHSLRSLLKLPAVSRKFTSLCRMEIKFHIIVKLKGDLSDLFKQVHTRIMLLRSLNSESVPYITSRGVLFVSKNVNETTYSLEGEGEGGGFRQHQQFLL